MKRSSITELVVDVDLRAVLDRGSTRLSWRWRPRRPPRPGSWCGRRSRSSRSMAPTMIIGITSRAMKIIGVRPPRASRPNRRGDHRCVSFTTRPAAVRRAHLQGRETPGRRRSAGCSLGPGRETASPRGIDLVRQVDGAPQVMSNSRSAPCIRWM